MCALEYVSPPDCVCDGAWVQGRVYGVGCRDVRGMVQGCIGYGVVTNLCFLHAELSNFYHLQVLDDDALQLGLLLLLASCRHARSVRAYSHTP